MLEEESWRKKPAPLDSIYGPYSSPKEIPFSRHLKISSLLIYFLGRSAANSFRRKKPVTAHEHVLPTGSGHKQISGEKTWDILEFFY